MNTTFVNAQTFNIDSLLKVLSVVKEDSNRVNVLNEISIFYLGIGKKTQAMQYALDARKKALSSNYEKGLAEAFCNMGLVYTQDSDYENAKSCYNRALKLREKNNDKKGVAAIYNHLGVLNEAIGGYFNAIDYHTKALTIRKEIGDKRGIAGSYNNLGNVYREIGELDKALNNYLISLKMKEELERETPGDIKIKKGVGNSYNNIGLIYIKMREYNKALEYIQKGLEIRELINDKQGIGMSYMNMGVVYNSQKLYKKTLEYFLKAIKIGEELGNKLDVAMVNDNMGSVYRSMGLSKNALECITKSLSIYEEIGNNQGATSAKLSIAEINMDEKKYDAADIVLHNAQEWCLKNKNKEFQRELYRLYTRLFELKEDYKKACIYDSLYIDINDSILNEESQKQMAEMGIRYDSEKKDRALLEKDFEISKQQAESVNKKNQRNLFLLGLTLILLLIVFVYRNYKEKKRINTELTNKAIFIEQQKLLVEEKNEKITDSINYAQRIQKAILPDRGLIKNIFAESFILFQPKDVVSGDFYWLHIIDENEILIAAVDCTGHGVPGALMSIMGYNLLEQIVKEQKIYTPSLILDELSKLIVFSLKQTEQSNEVKDGLDISLCKINSKNYEVEFAGAHNPLFIIHPNNTLDEIIADKRTVGFTINKKAAFFTNHKVQLQKGDCLYFFSDGFVDQIGGPENKKFFYQPFKELLKSIQPLSFDKQPHALLSRFNEWKGEKKQLDDVLVIGIKL